MQILKSLGSILLLAAFATGCSTAQTRETPSLVVPDRVALAPAERDPSLRACCTTYREITFHQYSADIPPSGMRQIRDVAAYLDQNPRLDLRIYDSATMANGEPISPSLRQRRDNAVRDALVNAGVSNYRIWTGAFGDPDPELMIVRPIDMLGQNQYRSMDNLTVSNDRGSRMN